MMKAKILVVDDEKTTRRALCEAFNQLGHQAMMAESGDAALQAMSAQEFDVVILDLQLPGTDGVAVLAAAEKLAPETEFIILTAHASTETAIVALRSGAFDYLRKPVSLELIFTAVKRALTKQQKRKRQKSALDLLQQAMATLQDREGAADYAAGEVLQTGPIALNEPQQTATFQEEQLQLTPMEYCLLRTFVRQPDRVLSYAELAFAARGVELEEHEARTMLRTHVYRLGQKLGGKETGVLQSIRGRGVILYSQAT